MPSATLNNSDPGSAIGQAGKSHSPASFKIKGQGGIKEKDNTSLKQRLHSAVPISQLPTTFCCRESAGAQVLQWYQGTAPHCPPRCPKLTKGPGKLGHLPWWYHSSSPAARKCQLCSWHPPALTSKLPSQDSECTSTSPVAKAEGKTPSGLSRGSRSPLNSSRFSPLPAPFPNYSHTSPVPADRAGHRDFQARDGRHLEKGEAVPGTGVWCSLQKGHPGSLLAWALHSQKQGVIKSLSQLLDHCPGCVRQKGVTFHGAGKILCS